jgi:hypothetical protein
MKKSIIALLSLLAASACADLIEIRVTGTANHNQLGYNSGAELYLHLGGQ